MFYSNIACMQEQGNGDSDVKETHDRHPGSLDVKNQYDIKQMFCCTLSLQYVEIKIDCRIEKLYAPADLCSSNETMKFQMTLYHTIIPQISVCLSFDFHENEIQLGDCAQSNHFT